MIKIIEEQNKDYREDILKIKETGIIINDNRDYYDDYDILRNIIANVEDYFELDDVLNMRVEVLLDYVREMVMVCGVEI